MITKIKENYQQSSDVLVEKMEARTAQIKYNKDVEALKENLATIASCDFFKTFTDISNRIPQAVTRSNDDLFNKRIDAFQNLTNLGIDLVATVITEGQVTNDEISRIEQYLQSNSADNQLIQRLNTLKTSKEENSKLNIEPKDLEELRRFIGHDLKVMINGILSDKNVKNEKSRDAAHSCLRVLNKEGDSKFVLDSTESQHAFVWEQLLEHIGKTDRVFNEHDLVKNKIPQVLLTAERLGICFEY